MTFPDTVSAFGKTYILEPSAPAFRFAWDDEIGDPYNYKCRTQMDGFIGPDNPPAVLRFAPYILPDSHNIGDYRVNLADPYDWKPAIIAMNGGDEQRFDYLVGPSRAQFNTTGWPKMAYVGMCGNRLRGERVGDWFRFETLKQSDVSRVAGWTIDNHPEFIHRFTCVSWKDGKTVHIESTGTPRGDVFYPLVTKEGYAFIPWRFVVQIT